MTIANDPPMPDLRAAINISAIIENEEDNVDEANAAVTPCSMTEYPLINKELQVEKLPKWYSLLHLPYAMLMMSSIQVFVYFLLTNKRTCHKLLFDPCQQEEGWRFISYMLLHKDWVHLVQNVLLQCLFGVYLESVQGNWKILFVYVGGGIGGALGAAAVRSDLLVGASAGVYALLLSYISYIILNYNKVKYKYKVITAVGVIITCDVIYCAIHYTFNVSPTISGGAHIFGAIIGLLIGLTLFDCTEDENKQYGRIVFRWSLILLVLMLVALIIADIKNIQGNCAIKLRLRTNVSE